MSSFDISFHVIFIFIKSLLLTISIYSIRYLILVIFKKNKEGNNLLLAMIPKGLAAAVLISMIKDSSEDLILLTYGVILNSIFISSILVYFRERGKVLFKNTKQMDNSNSENKVNSSFNDSSNSKNINENFINNKDDI
tara:strand:- start:400 stop:813 length:414 start_codon:yes stop_codon:yes gene_type:complete